MLLLTTMIPEDLRIHRAINFIADRLARYNYICFSRDRRAFGGSLFTWKAFALLWVPR